MISNVVPGRRGAFVFVAIGFLFVGVGCGGSDPAAIDAGAPTSAPTSSAEWACVSPSTFTPVLPPPGVAGLPEVTSTATAREYADGEVGRFVTEPTVVERDQSAGSAVFDLVDERGMLVGEVRVTRRDDGRWILSALTSCRDLERPA